MALEQSQNRTPILDEALSLKDAIQKSKIQRNVSNFASQKLSVEDDQDSKDNDFTDPAVVAAAVLEQVSFLRKLKFQYIEQNAKDKYVKSIVSDIDDAPIVNAEDNKELSAANEEKKKILKAAKIKLEEKQRDIRTLTPLVEEDYNKAKRLATEAAVLSQKILDARLALKRIRQSHPPPRLTIPTAEQKLESQVTEMQDLNDEIETITKKGQILKEKVRDGGMELESLRIERTEAEKSAKIGKNAAEDDGRLVPLYDWYTASLALHRYVYQLHASHTESENELGLTYLINNNESLHEMTITLIFAPNTRQLAEVRVSGLDEIGVDVGDVIDAHVQVNDVHGVVAAILMLARGKEGVY